MILVIGGIREARILAQKLAENEQVLLSVATEYGAKLAESENYSIVWGKKDTAGFETLIQENQIDLIIDCSHPFAENVSAQIEKAAHKTSVPLLRYCRQGIQKDEDFIYRTEDFFKAAEKAESFRGGKFIFSAIGSNHIPQLVAAIPPNKLVVRVLDVPQSLEICRKYGIPESQIISARGPFSLEDNLRDFKKFPVSVLLTKDSGTAGGTKEKLEAARIMKIPVVLVSPPVSAGIQYHSLDELYQAVKEKRKEQERRD